LAVYWRLARSSRAEKTTAVAPSVAAAGCISPRSTAITFVPPTRYRSTTSHAQAALEEIEQHVALAQPPLSFAPIRLAVAAADAPAQGMTLAQFAPTSPIGQDYCALADQIIAFLEGRR
jgi:cellulose biosynthesis protein BcsQ